MNDNQPETLVTFLGADAAMQALEHGTLCWRAPHRGDDLFALDADSTLAFDMRALLHVAGRSVAAAVFARQAPSGVPGHPMTSVVRRWRAQRRFNSEDEVLRALRTVLPGMAERQMEAVEEVLTDWRALTARVRVLHLFERHNDPALWQHRAEHHGGIALRFACGENSTLGQPYPVHYQNRRAQITTLQEQVEVLLGQSRHVAQTQFRERLLTRSRADAEEREWRCFRHYDASGKPDTGGEDGPDGEQVVFDPGDLQAIYLGARLAPARCERALALAAERYPGARVFQATPHAREFVLDFQPVGGNETESPGEDTHEEGDAAGARVRATA